MQSHMKIVQILADWKWTGPSEPVLSLSHRQARMGNDVTLMVRRPPADHEDTESILVYARGIGPDPSRNLPADTPLTVSTELDLNTRTKPDNFFGVPGFIRDIRRLSRYIDTNEVDVVHVHSSHDHTLAGLARVSARRKPIIVRTDHKRNFISRGAGNRLLLRRFTDGIISFSHRGAKAIETRFDFPPEHIRVIDPALELDRWNPDDGYTSMRPRFGIPGDALVIGMVARFQKYRKTDMVIEAFAALTKDYPDARLLLLGRSSQMTESVHKPAKALGVSDRVVTPGYVMEGYRDALLSMDVFVFMMPGSDGTARALREAQVLGLPVVAIDVGMIAELVDDGRTGLLIEQTPEGLERALRRLVEDESFRKKLGETTRREALKRYDPKRQATETLAFYTQLTGRT